MSDLLADEILYPVDFERAGQSDSEIGGTPADFSQPSLVLAGVQCAIQSANPHEIETWMQRGVKISHKLYTEDQRALQITLGMRAKDARFTPPLYYVVCGSNDMGGTGEIFGIWAQLTQ